MTSNTELYEQAVRAAQERYDAEKARKKAAVAACDARLKARPMETRAKVRARAERYRAVAAEIERALSGGALFHWKGSENHLIQVAADMGLTVITQSRAEKAGYTLKRGQKPVGRAYFGAPISKYANVYILECQFNKASG